jgi:O-antigen biosynthesis protein WbqP
MKRIFDLSLFFILAILLIIPMLLIAIALYYSSGGPIIYWSDRVGKNCVIFKMPKFRTMLINTPSVATHLLNRPDSYLTPLGGWLRRSSLDEFPQLFSILKGDMTFIGPRPALYNQKDLINLRNNSGLNKLSPGITGWAQVNGRDELSISEKVALDIEYMHRQSFWFDIKILWMTFLKVFKRDGVSH